jgi:hypothetical protein
MMVVAGEIPHEDVNGVFGPYSRCRPTPHAADRWIGAIFRRGSDQLAFPLGRCRFQRRLMVAVGPLCQRLLRLKAQVFMIRRTRFYLR